MFATQKNNTKVQKNDIKLLTPTIKGCIKHKEFKEAFMARNYPDFIENAMICNFINFRRIGRDRWDYFEQDGYRKLSTVLQKSKDISWERLYVYYHDIYILMQYIANYDEKYNGDGDEKYCNDETVTEDGFEKIIEENIDNPYINWKAIYDYVEDNYRWRQDYLDHFERIVLRVLYKYRKQLNQKSDFW